MYKSAIRTVPRRILQAQTIQSSSRRFLSTAAPAKKSGGWKSTTARWAAAAGIIYYYNTSNLFAEEPEVAIRTPDGSIHAVQESSQPTIDAIVEEKRQRYAQRIAEERKKNREEKGETTEEQQAVGEEMEEGMEGLEEEAGQQGAFNEETGEINWDCPCLGGMAHGPCGDEFKAAFSCFVYSNEEPKGIECIERFKGMQDCFREHPEVYASELEDEEDEIAEELRAREAAKSEAEPAQEKSESLSSAETKAPHPEAKVVAEKGLESNTTSTGILKSTDKENELVREAANDTSSG